MARLQPSGIITMSDILINMGVGRGFNSFDGTETLAMGAAPAADMTKNNSICMPYQKEAVASKGSGAAGPGPNFNWYSTVPVNWRPSRISEFYSAYNNKPQVTGYATAQTSPPGQGQQDSQHCTLTVIASNSDAWSSGSTPYYLWVEGSGTGAPGFGAWSVATDNQGTSKSYYVSGLNGSGAWTIIVCDYEGCGSRSEIRSTIKYN